MAALGMQARASPLVLGAGFRERLARRLGVGALGEPSFGDASGWDVVMPIGDGRGMLVCDFRGVLGSEHPFVLRRMINQSKRFGICGQRVLIVDSIEGLTVEWVCYTFSNYGVRVLLSSELRPKIIRRA